MYYCMCGDGVCIRNNIILICRVGTTGIRAAGAVRIQCVRRERKLACSRKEPVSIYV